MTSESSDFFESKDQHPWSRIKDRVLGSYMSPYMAKIVKKGQPILLIDAFAGPGRTKDGEPGSPLIICHAGEKNAKGRYKAIFVNNNEKYHQQLDQILQAGGWRKSATPILGDGAEILRSVVPLLNTQSVFLYIDPFGLNCEFDILEPFLQRKKTFSTEILINLQTPILHRLAARDAYLGGTGDPLQIGKFHEKLTRTLGGDYWKEILLADNKWDTKTREQKVIDGYRQKLASTGYLTYTGSCPVQETRDSRTKYYMVFASPHPHAMFLFNEAMCKAFNGYMNEEETKDTLFADLPWQAWRDTKELEGVVADYVRKYPAKTRYELWILILQNQFMRFTHSEYIKVVDSLVKENRIICSTPVGSTIRHTKKLNNECVLEPA